jgi:putative nucleotidyltransferase with HDIG domain
MSQTGGNMATTESTSTLELDTKAKLELFYKVSKKVGSVPRMARLLEQIIEMTQNALDASAASILLFNDNERELYFEAASGPVEKVLRHVKVNTQNSIAGQVAHTGKSLIVNNVSRSRNFRSNIDEITGFATKSLICVPLVASQKTIGVLEVLNKLDGSNFDESDIHVVVPVATIAAMAIENTRLHQTILDAYKNTIVTLAGAIDAKDPYTRGHSQRVMELTMLAGSSLLLSAEEMETLEYAAILHDIGKIVVDGQILNKPDTLTPSEWNIIREHPAIGANLLNKIPFLEKASKVVLHHHERYDGTGYPDGLKGEDIPMGARLIAVADAFDTMTTDRSYRSALNIDYAISELKSGAGTQFCPVAVEAFISGFLACVKS